MSNQIIIVPYRNRNDHIAKFLPHIERNLPHMHICIVEQSFDSKPFNRAKLLNIGFLQNKEHEYFIFHDVDMLPLLVDYKPAAGVTQLIKNDIQLLDYLGGVTMFDKYTFEKVGGYHNDYFHRAEDNEMRFNLKRLNIPVRTRYGKFEILQHEKSGPDFIPRLWAISQRPRKKQNQLVECKYDVLKVNELTHVVNCKSIVKHLIVSI